ncbi:REP-associated tyrosine transposase [Saccharicrinis sp. 156]|uniref:REP-associated tyrosine transposase n=1 Tax=Saccharicrinis sp. 156 TaxID=3417574 RepID=UPI003D33DC59
MSSKYKVRNQEALHFVTATIIDWVDLFTRPIYKHILVESLEYCQNKKDLKVHAYVIMTSHIHLIVSSSGSNLEDIIRDFKKYTSKELLAAIKEHPESRREWLLNKFSYAANRIKRGANFKIWKDGFHPVELATTEMLTQRLDYVHKNPVEEEIVIKPEDYKYSSAIDYAGGKGVLSLVQI